MGIFVYMSTAAGNVQVGQHVSTIPSRESGRRTTSAGTVTSIERYTIGSQEFVDLKMSAELLTLTMSAEALVDVA